MLTDLLIKKIHDLKYSDIPLTTLQCIKLGIIDSLGAMIAGSTHPITYKILQYLTQQYAPKTSILILHKELYLDPCSTAMYYGVAGHILDFEPLWHPPTHPCSPILAGLLSVPHLAKPCTGKDFLLAFLIGLEVTAKFRLLSKNHDVPITFHPPGVEGMLGATMAISKFLGFTPIQMKHALGITASRLSAIMANVGTMIKSTHIGHASRMAVESNLLVANGFNACENIIEHHSGILAVYYPETSIDTAERIFKSFADPFHIEKHGFGIKKYPCQFGIHWGIDAALRLRSKISNAEDIIKILIIYPYLKYIDRAHPTTELEAKFSLQHTIVIALLFGTVEEKHFSLEFIHDTMVKNLRDKIKLDFDYSLEKSFDTMEGSISISLKNNQNLSDKCSFPLGHWKNPLSKTKIEEKFLNNVSNVLPLKQADSLLKNLDELENEDNLNMILAALKYFDKAPKN